MGDAARRRREDAAAHADRAAQLERAREELADRAVTEERLRIARELHDVVAHAMSAIAVQAGTGRVAFDREPEVARASLAEIEGLSRQGLAEMRRMLGVLRPAPQPGVHEVLPPPASLDQVDRLVATAAAAGVAVTVRVEGAPRRLAPGVDLAAYRIAQEALTNVVRHAGADQARLTLRFSPDGLELEVEDGGPAGIAARAAPLPPAELGSRCGVGIVGMRERAAACGGTLSAGPCPGGGFRVVARLPGGAPLPGGAARGEVR
jgi:signal transduction histidine kinase